MKILKTCLALSVAAGLASFALADDTAPNDGPGWTGLTNPEAVIEARQALMFESEELMKPIDTYTVDPSIDPAVMLANADTVSAMLLAVPHLFPPTTNLFDPDAEEPETLALPRIWQEFPSFYALAENASTTAEHMAEMENPTPEELDSAALALRATCDACHTLYLNPYVPGEVTEEDLDFDFDSVFPKD